MHGKWNERTFEDKIREVLIILVVILLLIPAYKHKSILVTVIVIGILFDHLSQLDLLPFGGEESFTFSAPVILAGGLALGAAGIYHSSRIFLFTGIYSVTSKFNYKVCKPSFISKPCFIWVHISL